MRITPNLLADAADILTELLKFAQPADAVLSAYFRRERTGSSERAFLAETLYAVLRRLRWLRLLAGAKASPRDLLLASFARQQGMPQRALEEALDARGFKRYAELKAVAEPAQSLAERCDFPDWLVERLAPHMDEAALLALARGLNSSAPLDLRVNEFRAGRDEVLAQLKVEGIAATPCRFAPSGIRLKGKPGLSKHALYLTGKIEVQDEGSQLLGYLVAPRRGEMVADFCAGAGGKTLLLGAMMRSSGRLYAFDVSAARLAKLKPRAARSGLSNIHPACIAGENDPRIKRLAGKLDRVLVDAPCSGLGTLRRNPDLKWRQTPQGIAELTRKQGEILASASRLVKRGGRLVYATCSLLHEENQAIVETFLAQHSDFRRVSARAVLAKQSIDPGADAFVGDDLQLLPHLHDTDGFYAAVLERAQ
jgi:16S rRNA (cytosine967-C5)-methyltransferase